ncbi:efflux RND transporter periplasmic adaptor subunit [Acinetobacter sp. WZC-1]|uniref:efflux RND transporter periplasmic adaptor subunit n=1 Tax=Acinetobacter sp. WZC-1 TaxID=3459034 RepID=UPI00403D8D32
MPHAYPTAPHLQFIKKLSIICFSLLLIACDKQQTAGPAASVQKQHIELIQQDLVSVRQGTSVSRAVFTGTIRAVHQGSIQAQVTATATSVQVQVGQKVTRGQTLAVLNNQDNAARLAQSRASLASTQAQATQASHMLQRKKRLYDQGFISRLEYEQTQVDYQAQLENVKAQQASVDIAQKASQDGIIKSPISGVITRRQVEPGQTVTAGQTLFEVTDPDQLEIQAKLPSDLQAALKVGNKIEYRIQGNPQRLTATLSRISPVADQVSRQIEFFARPVESINSLSIGAFVEGAILGAAQIEGQLIPLDTIQDVQRSPYVWVIRDNKVQQIKITVLDQQISDNTAIVRGLKLTDRISKVRLNPEDLNKTAIISSS